MTTKVFVLDTNVLLEDPHSLWKFGRHNVVMAISVLEELDSFKKELSVRGVNARKVLRYLDQLAQHGDFTAGISLATTDQPLGELTLTLSSGATGVLTIHPHSAPLPVGLTDTPDHRILALALSLHGAPGDAAAAVILVSNDINLRVKAAVYGVMSEDYRGAKSGVADGYDAALKTINLTPEQAHQFRTDQKLAYSDHLYHNEYVYLAMQPASLKDPLSYQHRVAMSRGGQIQTVPQGGCEVWGIAARNVEQYCAVSALLDDQIRLVTLTGKAGSGKTLLAMACGLHKTTEEDTYQKLLCSRPIFPMGQDIGYLPGDVDAKISPWMQPIFDSLEYLVSGGSRGGLAMLSSVRELFDQNLVAVEPLTYFRGRSLTHHYFVVDEAQNLSSHEVKAIVTRAGQGTKIVLTGDPEQIDVPYLDRNNNGLVYAAEKLRASPLSAHIHLTKGERSELAELAAELL